MRGSVKVADGSPFKIHRELKSILGNETIKSEPNLVASAFEHIKNAKINLNTIDNLHVQCSPPWEEHKVNVDISLTKQRKEDTGIQGNENVDKLAKAALDKASYSGKLICWPDLEPKINTFIHSVVWQESWDAEGANKPHEVLLNLREDLHKRDKGGGRKWETVMCRLQNLCLSGPLTPKKALGVAATREHQRMESSTPHRLRKRHVEEPQGKVNV
ncbi:hypothetical protein PoB_007649400 [Plakobranchus ocellatus]|uniref:Uncharacterized protein n=1 Tax=Plakobranchus ocellatus TaxID=259542 RepID=A0AAV4E0G6_9GAST|nr:hypothetical protein PoB_007649400 [Plakobranchus ocellatus]